MIFIRSNWTDVNRELDRLVQMPDAKTKGALDTVIGLGLEMTQAVVHVQTGSLKSSGKRVPGSTRAKSKWSGGIRYGGVSAGIHNPVNYAIYEQRRGGAHDFMSPLPLLDAAYVTAILEGMRG